MLSLLCLFIVTVVLGFAGWNLVLIVPVLGHCFNFAFQPGPTQSGQPESPNFSLESRVLNKPCRENTGFLHMRKQRRRSASRYREADQRLCFRYKDSTISLLPKYKISSLQPSSVAVQPGLCGAWWETPKTGFLTTRLKLSRQQKNKVFHYAAQLY